MDGWNEIVCETPTFLRGKSISHVTQDELACSDGEEDVPVSPDIVFRDIPPSRTPNVDTSNITEGTPSITVAWYVKTHEDVAGFRLYVQNVTTGIQTSRLELPYTTRYTEFAVPAYGTHYVCITAVDSMGHERTRRKEQCQEMVAAGTSVKSSVLVILAGFLISLIVRR